MLLYCIAGVYSSWFDLFIDNASWFGVYIFWGAFYILGFLYLRGFDALGFLYCFFDFMLVWCFFDFLGVFIFGFFDAFLMIFWFFYDFFSWLFNCYYSPKWVHFLKFSCNSFFFVYNGWRNDEVTRNKSPRKVYGFASGI